MTVDRTSWLDLSLGRFRNGTIGIPHDVSEEYEEQMKALTRLYQKDKQGNPVGSYFNGSKPDHYGHSRNYCEIAFTIAATGWSSQDITKVM